MSPSPKDVAPCLDCGKPRGDGGAMGLCRECSRTREELIRGAELIDRLDGIVSYSAAANGHDSPPGSTERVVIAESFSDIRTERTRWLWAGRIPLGTASLLVGREKLGKSTLTTELAARLSRGELPGDLAGQPVVSLFVSYEDHAGSTIKPRLLAAGADVKLVRHLHAERGGMRDLVSLPDDLGWIDMLARKWGARFLIIDPLSASLNGEINANRDQDIRRALAPLVQLAEEVELAVLCLAHWNKSQGGDSLSRVLGSRGLTAAVRSVLAFGREPDAEDGSPDRVLAHAACNLAREAPSLACRIEPREVEADDGQIMETTRLVMLGESGAQADDLLVTRSDDDRTDTDIAGEWLADELADGRWQESREIKARAKVAGISERTLQRAKKMLEIEDRRDGFQGVSEWRLPVAPTPSQTAGATAAGATGKTPVGIRDQLSLSPQSRHVSALGATAVNGDLVERLRYLTGRKEAMSREIEACAPTLAELDAEQLDEQLLATFPGSQLEVW